MTCRRSAEHFHVAVDIVLNDMATSRTLEPDVVPALRQFELPRARSSRAQATKPKRLGAICHPAQFRTLLASKSEPPLSGAGCRRICGAFCHLPSF
jgi:hypothetical protein